MATNKVYLRYSLYALSLLACVSLLTFAILWNSRPVVAAELVYSDVALDHPVYQMCQQLLCIGAIRHRSGKRLALYEKITATEWNYALQQISRHLDRVIPEAALFKNDNEITAAAIRRRVHRITGEDSDLVGVAYPDYSRLSAYFMLEHALFTRRHD